jgi:hypothetical protein
MGGLAHRIPSSSRARRSNGRGGVTLKVNDAAGITLLLKRALFQSARSVTLDHKAPAAKVNEGSQSAPSAYAEVYGDADDGG